MSLRAFICLSYWNEISQRDKCSVSITYGQRGGCSRNQAEMGKNWEAQLGKQLPPHKFSQSPNNWNETLGLNLVTHPGPAAHWYHFFGQMEKHRSFSMQTPWRTLPFPRNCWNLCSWLRERSAPQNWETKVKGAAFTPGTEQPGLVFHTSATSKCHSVPTWQGCVSTGVRYLSFQGWAGHFLTDNSTGPDKWLNKLRLGGIFFFFFSVPTLKAWLWSQLKQRPCSSSADKDNAASQVELAGTELDGKADTTAEAMASPALMPAAHSCWRNGISVEGAFATQWAEDGLWGWQNGCG